MSVSLSKPKTRFMIGAGALFLAACSYSMALERTLQLEAPIEISCVESALQDLGRKVILSDSDIYYDHPSSGETGTIEFKKKSKRGFKKIIHSNYSSGECFADSNAVASAMEKTETHILKACGAKLQQVVTQKITGPDKTCR